MGTTRSTISRTSPTAEFKMEGDLLSQSTSGNWSKLRLYMQCKNTGNSSSYYGGYGYQKVQWNDSDLTGMTESGNPFLPSGVSAGALRWRNGPSDQVVIYHDANGNAAQVEIKHTIYFDTGAYPQSETWDYTPPRIPKVPGKPGKPSVSSATPTSATFSWSAASRGHADITDYYLEVWEYGKFPTMVFASSVGTSRSKALSGLDPNTRYFSRVTAVNSDGSGPLSEADLFTTPVGVPGTPTSVTISYVSDTQMSVGWAHNSPEDSYPTSSQVRQSVNNAAFVYLPPISVTTSVAIAAGANRKYVVQVREGNSTGWSGLYSSGPAFTTPAAPTDVAAAKNASLNIVITWTPQVGFIEHQHIVEHGTVSGGTTTWDGSPLATVAGGTSTYTHTSPDSGALHVYRVVRPCRNPRFGFIQEGNKSWEGRFVRCRQQLHSVRGGLRGTQCPYAGVFRKHPVHVLVARIR